MFSIHRKLFLALRKRFEWSKSLLFSFLLSSTKIPLSKISDSSPSTERGISPTHYRYLGNPATLSLFPVYHHYTKILFHEEHPNKKIAFFQLGLNTDHSSGIQESHRNATQLVSVLLSIYYIILQ